MKLTFFHAAWIGIILSNSFSVHAQSTEYQVVVGAFAKENNAAKFAGYVKRTFFQSNYEFNQGRNLYYVYVWKGFDRLEAINLAKILQRQPKFFDCWVHSKQLSDNARVISESTPADKDDESKVPLESTPLEPEPSKTDSLQTIDQKDNLTDTIHDNSLEIESRAVKGKLFKFDVRTKEGTGLIAKVHHVNTKLGKDIASYSSDREWDVPSPAGTNKDMTIVCGVFGYREVTRVVNYTNPAKLKDVRQGAAGEWIVPFELQKLKSGDYSIMYDVSFFKNSVAMQEKSKVDLDALLSMLQNNSRLKIRIHGHVNGGKDRVYTGLSAEKSYFEQGSVSKTKIAATELSTLRAQSVRDYLMDNGIDKSRLDVKGDGSKSMIVPETHPTSHLNDRIEIQILKD